jgi:hypothetical protein
MDLKRIGWACIDWIVLAQDLVHVAALMIVVMNFQDL